MLEKFKYISLMFQESVPRVQYGVHKTAWCVKSLRVCKDLLIRSQIYLLNKISYVFKFNMNFIMHLFVKIIYLLKNIFLYVHENENYLNSVLCRIPVV